MHGLHLTADLRDCRAEPTLLTDAGQLRAVCLEAVDRAGLHAVGELFHRFAPRLADGAVGVTGVVLLAESHLAVHTWPELASATLDVYVCNVGADNSARAQALFDALLGSFGAARIERHALQRGDIAAAREAPALRTTTPPASNPALAP